MVAHTYNTRKNKLNVNQPIYLPPQLIMYSTPKPMTKSPSDYDLVNQLCVTLAKISLCDLLHSALVYQGIL